MRLVERLPEDVVRKIAAGEVIIRPVNAVKELLENSLDAGATDISVTLKDGGLALLQVKDNGCGIWREDLELVCERFATSKLRTVDDLSRMATFGFRGEALASIAMVSAVNVTSKRRDAACAFQINYRAGAMVGRVRPSAGGDGTTITAEGMFSESESRLRALRNTADEGARVLDLVAKYAVQRPDVSFAVRRDDRGCELRTHGTGSRTSTLAALYGDEVAGGAIDLELADAELHFELVGTMSRPYSMHSAAGRDAKRRRQRQFVLFINNRPVSCVPLKTATETTLGARGLATTYLLVSLKIDPARVDVNVHPTKESVYFLQQDDVIEKIQRYLDSVLATLLDSERMAERASAAAAMGSGNNAMVPFAGASTPASVTVAPQRRDTVEAERRGDGGGGFRLISHVPSSASNSIGRSPSSVPPLKKAVSSSGGSGGSGRKEGGGEGDDTRRDHETVRVSSGERRLEQFFVASQHNAAASEISLVPAPESSDEGAPQTSSQEDILSEYRQQTVREFNLESLDEIRSDIVGRTSKRARVVFRSLILVGCVSPEVALIQVDTTLYAIHLRRVVEEMLFQMSIFAFGNLGTYRLEEPLPVLPLLTAATPDSSEEELRECAEFLTGKGAMLHDYFSLSFERLHSGTEDEEIGDVYLTTLPSLIHGHAAQMAALPEFLLCLLSRVDWEDERGCIEGVARSIAAFYTPHERWTSGDLYEDPESGEGENDAFEDKENERGEEVAGKEATEPGTKGTTWKSVVTDLLLPKVKERLLAPDAWMDDGTVKEATSLKELYKVFERC